MLRRKNDVEDFKLTIEMLEIVPYVAFAYRPVSDNSVYGYLWGLLADLTSKKGVFDDILPEFRQFYEVYGSCDPVSSVEGSVSMGSTYNWHMSPNNPNGTTGGAPGSILVNSHNAGNLSHGNVFIPLFKKVVMPSAQELAVWRITDDYEPLLSCFKPITPGEAVIALERYNYDSMKQHRGQSYTPPSDRFLYPLIG